MDQTVLSESLKIKNCLIKWLSITSFKHAREEEKSAFRKVERLSEKVIKIKSHLEFNKTCIINKLLPTYTNVNLHDDAARREEFVLEFRMNLVRRQIEELSDKLRSIEPELVTAKLDLRNACHSDLRHAALGCFLSRLEKRIEETTRISQHRKLCHLYGGHLCMKETRDSVVNLSRVILDNELREIFSMGMNYHLQSKIDHTNRKVQVEKLFEDIKNKETGKAVTIEDESSLKTDLERFGRKELTPARQPLSKRQENLIKEFNRNEDIVVRKADKSNVFVILDRDFYTDGINEILSDETKFTKINRDPTEALKKELNLLISQVRRGSQDSNMQKLSGHFDPGYIYANPKIHKRLENPPLRPIISQIGTVTYDISKHVNNIIGKYLPKQFQADSTYEFLSILRSCQNVKMLASLDVESLFSSVPVLETIDIIIKNVYDTPTVTPPPAIPRDTMRRLLEICTTLTPFRNINGELYVQKEGVSMGNPLGPTFANYYMCDLENRIFSMYPDCKPSMYVRYVDDICICVDNYHSILKLKSLFEQHSVLKFTHELETKKSMPFLDVLIQRKHQTIKTSVYTKATDYGDCLNFNSICPDRYKTGVIKSFLFRAYEVSSSWLEFHSEITRLKQLLTNNDFPMIIIDRTINNFLHIKQKNNHDNENASDRQINLFFHNQMSSNYKQDEQQLIGIINKNVHPINDLNKIKLVIYYKSKKLGSLFIKNNVHSRSKDISDRHHVVYQYSCNRVGCEAAQTYIGYTTCTIKDRFRMHTQNCSSIKKHLTTVHEIDRITTAELVKDVQVLASASDKRDLIFLEALILKEKKPPINSQMEGEDRILKVFRH